MMTIDQANTTLGCFENTIFGEEHFADVLAKIAAFNAKMTKKGLPLVEMEIVEVFDVWVHLNGKSLRRSEPEGLERFKFVKSIGRYVKITFPPLRFDGWRLIGVMKTFQGQNIISSVPGCSIPEHLWGRVSQCDHCGHNRHRAETFVIHNEEADEYMVLGRTCLKDFLGHQAGSLLFVYEAKDEDFFDRGFSVAPTSFDIKHFTYLVAGCIMKDGWRSKASCKYEGIPTADTAKDIYMDIVPFRWSALEWEAYKAERMPTEDWIHVADRALEWAKSLDQSSSEFERNLSTLARSESTPWRHLGYVAAIIPSFMKLESEKKEKPGKVESQYVGVVGNRPEMTVTVEAVISCPTQYGTSGLHIMRDQVGNRITWFASSNWLTVGSSYRVKATIKKHEIYKEQKQTAVSRVSVVEELTDSNDSERA